MTNDDLTEAMLGYGLKIDEQQFTRGTQVTRVRLRKDPDDGQYCVSVVHWIGTKNKYKGGYETRFRSIVEAYLDYNRLLKAYK